MILSLPQGGQKEKPWAFLPYDWLQEGFFSSWMNEERRWETGVTSYSREIHDVAPAGPLNDWLQWVYF